MPITLNGTTGIDAPLGTASVPSYGNTTNVNTGLYYPTSTTLGLSTNGTAALTIDASQNVGIGTSSPSFDSGSGLQVSRAGVSTLRLSDTTDATNIEIKAAVGAVAVSGRGNYPLLFETNGTERMRIDSSGNVGIGLTANSGTKLQVAAATNITLGIANATTVTGAVTLEAINNARSANIPMELRATKFDLTGPTTSISVDTSGNVGFNASTPTQYDTSGGKILNIRGTASNSAPATIFMNGNSSLPGAGYYTQEVFTIGVTASQEISRVTGTGANGFRSMIRISLCGHTGAKGNGHIYAMYYWDGGTAAPVQIFRYDSGTNIPGLSFNTSTSNVLITNLSSSDGSNLFQGVMMIEYFLPVDFASSTYTIS